MMFWKKQNCRDSRQARGFKGPGAGEESQLMVTHRGWGGQ